MKRALRNFGSLMGNCIYDKNFLNDIAKVKPPGKTPLDFSTLHRPGQVSDSDGKIIGIAKAETSKGPASATTAGQQNEGVSNNKMPDQVPRNAAHHNQKQVVPVVQQNKPQAPAQRPPQPVRQHQPNQQYTNQQQNRLQAQQQALGQQSTTASTISAGQNAMHTRSTATLNRNPAQVKLQDAANRSLNSEDMLYEGMDFEEESTQIEIGAGKYDDSGFGEGDSVMRGNNEADQSISSLPQTAKNGQNGQNSGAIPQQHQPARQGPPQPRAPPQARHPHPNGAPRVQNGQNGPITPMMEQQFRVKQEPVVIRTGNNQNQVRFTLRRNTRLLLAKTVFAQPHVRRISGGAPSSAEGRPQLPVQANQTEDVHASQQSRFQPGGSSGSRNRGVGAQAQGSSPLQHLQSQGMHSQGGTIGFAPPPAGVAVPESVTFTTARGIKRNFAE